MRLAFRSVAAPVSATVTFGDLTKAPVKLNGMKDVFTADIPVPVDLPVGLVEIKLSATDKQSREFNFSEYVYVVDPSGDEGPNLFSFVRQQTTGDGRIILKTGDTLVGISNKKIRSATLQGSGSNLFNVSVVNGQVQLVPVDDGEAGPLSLRFDVEDGPSFTSNQFRISATSSGPTVTLQNFTNYSWVRNSVNVSFNLASRGRVANVEYSLDMGDTWQRALSASDISGLRAPVNTNVSRTFDLTGAPDGSINILIKASGDTDFNIAEFTVLKDTAAPSAQTIVPISEAKVNGTIRMAFAVEEMGVIQSVAYRRNASSAPREVFNDNQWTGDYSPRFFEILMDSLIMPLDNAMRFTFTDKAGNSSEISAW